MEKLYRLLIVDDEYHVVDWLAELFGEQKEIPLEIYRAHLVREALEILNRVKIDVVLSDIRMPGMDGFDLADRITANWPQAKIIFLTGYNEFDYAYKAARYKNMSFLLKTEDDDVILTAVKKAVGALEEEQKQLLLASAYADMKRLAAWQMRQNILRQWLDRGTREQDSLYAQELPFRFREKVWALCIRSEERADSLLERERFLVSLEQLLQSMLFEKGDVCVVPMENSYFLALVQPRKEQQIAVYLQEMLDVFSVSVLEELKQHVFFVLYEAGIPFDAVQEKYEVLKLAADDVADTGNLYGGRILSREEEERLQEKNEQFWQGSVSRQKIDRMAECLEQGRREEFFALFQGIYEVVTLIASRHYYPAIELFQSISAIYLSRINRKKLVERLAFKTALGKLMNLYEFSDWKEAFDYLRQMGELLFEEQKEEQSGRNDAFLEAIQRFIKENLKEDLSLTWIAQQMHYNPSYISRLFKQLSGRNLSEYILEEKIAYAKCRLEASADTVAAIALEVGFESSQYFSVVFKKQTGMTPGDYRHRHG